MPLLFMSHSYKDKKLAGKIALDLKGAGINVWFDEHEILVGDHISEKIEEGLSQSDFIAVLISNSAIKSGWVNKEWRSMISKEVEQKNILVLPLLAEKCESPLMLKDKKHIDFSGSYDESIEELILSIEGHWKNHPNNKITKTNSKSKVKNKKSLLNNRVCSKVNTRISLRSKPILDLSREMLIHEIREYGLFDIDFNPDGMGLVHTYESKLINELEVVLDHVVGLMWQTETCGFDMQAEAANGYVRYANLKKFGGYSDWRLPSMAELMSLLERDKPQSECYIASYFSDCPFFIWSSDRHGMFEEHDYYGPYYYAWGVAPKRGGCQMCIGMSGHVRLVRDHK